MNRLVCALLLALSSALLIHADNADVHLFPGIHDDPLYDQHTYQRVRDITVSVAWNQVELREAMRDLTRAVRTTHPIHADINFRISSSANDAFRSSKVSLTLKDAPIYQVLEYLSRQVPFTIKTRHDIVLLEPLPAK